MASTKKKILIIEDKNSVAQDDSLWAKKDGSVVDLRMTPMGRIESTGKIAPNHTKQTHKTKKKILIIEDEKPIARALELKLAHEGFEVKTVFGGEEGVASLEKESYALILLDLVMPQMDGFMVLKTLKDKKIKTPVMVLTNLSQEDDEKRTKVFGVNEFFVKSNTSLANIVERVALFLQ